MGEMFGIQSIEQVYFYILIFCTILSVVLFLVGDILQFDGPIDPVLIVPWIAFVSLFGYLGETLSTIGSVWIFIIAVLLSSVIVFLLNFYILIPLKNSETTISVSEKTLEGRVATVVTPIPIKGMGEITISSVTGTMSRPAAFYTEQDGQINNGEEVLIIEVRERVCYVVPYVENF